MNFNRVKLVLKVIMVGCFVIEGVNWIDVVVMFVEFGFNLLECLVF